MIVQIVFSVKCCPGMTRLPLGSLSNRREAIFDVGHVLLLRYWSKRDPTRRRRHPLQQPI